jgi:phosphoglucomutase
MEKAARIMSDLRESTPKEVAGFAVTRINDYGLRTSKDLVNGGSDPISLPKSNVLELILGDKGSVIARPSGTEPKVKFYYTAVAEDAKAANKLLGDMINQMSR